jgi:SAM-dependent methyltransferase
MPCYDVTEMNLGLGEWFQYVQCTDCGCLQIAELPRDMQRFYPPDYYSFARDPLRNRGLRRWIRSHRDRYAITGRGLVGRGLAQIYPYRFAAVREWLQRTGATPTSRILDVGCGRGELLFDLASHGFRHLTGVDPFIAGDIRYANGARVIHGILADVTGTFDLIMFHHALEHIAEQREALRAAAERLAPDGFCLVRIPTVSSFAWEHYREQWVQLDAPRHFVLHSIRSLGRVAEDAGLQLVATVYDSTEFQFTGSESYCQGVPLAEGGVRFSRRELRAFRKRAAAFNREGRGDQAAFYFRRA